MALAAPSAAGPRVWVQAVPGGLRGALWQEDVKAFPNAPLQGQQPLLLQYAQEEQKLLGDVQINTVQQSLRCCLPPALGNLMSCLPQQGAPGAGSR